MIEEEKINTHNSVFLERTLKDHLSKIYSAIRYILATIFSRLFSAFRQLQMYIVSFMYRVAFVMLFRHSLLSWLPCYYNIVRMYCYFHLLFPHRITRVTWVTRTILWSSLFLNGWKQTKHFGDAPCILIKNKLMSYNIANYSSNYYIITLLSVYIIKLIALDNSYLYILFIYFLHKISPNHLEIIYITITITYLYNIFHINSC